MQNHEFNKLWNESIMANIRQRILAAGLPDPATKTRETEIVNTKTVFIYLAKSHNCTYKGIGRFLGITHATAIYHQTRALNVLNMPKYNPDLYNALAKFIS